MPAEIVLSGLWPTVSCFLVFGYAVMVTVLVCASYRSSQPQVSQRGPNSSTLSLLFDAPGFDAGGHAMQVGYTMNCIGWFWVICWAVVPVLGQLLLLLYTFAMYDVDPLSLSVHGRSDFLIQPFMVLVFASALLAALSVHRYSHLTKCFLNPCPLGIAKTVSVTAGDQTHWCHVEEGEGFRFMTFMCYRYVFDETVGRFRPIGEVTVTGRMAEERYRSGGLPASIAEELHHRVGPNVVDVRVPGICASLFEEFHTKVYIYQSYCIWLFFFFRIWNIGCLWVLLVFTSGCFKSLAITRRNRLKIQSLARYRCDCCVFRDGVKCSCDSSELVPGDLLVVLPNMRVPCDAVLIFGGSVMHEAMLTGEPMPIAKVPIDQEAASCKDDNLLYAGTEVMDTIATGLGDTVAVIQSIGGATEKANLLRLVLFPCDVPFQYDASLQKVYALLVAYTVISGILVLVVPHPFNEEDMTITVVRAVFCVLQAINPMLGVAVAAGQTVAAKNLQARGIICMSSQRIPMAGCVDIMVLDKTGTITKDAMEFHSVQICENGVMGTVYTADRLVDMPMLMQCLMASCHKLSPFKGEYTGNHVEIEMFKALGSWTLETSNESRIVTNGAVCLKVLRVLDFDHVKMISGCVCRLPNGETYVFIKGAASAVNSLCLDTSQEFVAESDAWSKKCYYVLGCAARQLGASTPGDIARNDLECGLKHCGLMMFKNELKPDSIFALAELRSGSTAVTICTGDNLLAGISVAKQVGVIATHQLILRLEADEDAISWIDMDGKSLRVDGRNLAALSACIVMEQTDWEALRRSPLLRFVLPHVRVFGRMKPEGKVAVVEELQALGYYVGMCGDGGNDCGALRTAHVGLALTEADASIVAPFCAGQDRSLLLLVQLLKEGRACLATNVACFSYYLGYGLTVTSATKTTLTLLNDSNPPEWQWMYIDFFVALLIPSAMIHCRPSNVLSPFRPSSSLVSARVVTSCLGSWIIFGVFLFWGLELLFQQPFYMPWNPATIGIAGDMFTKQGDNFETETTFIFVAAHLATCGLVYSFGSHHRQSLIQNKRLLFLYSLAVGGLVVLVLTARTSFNCLMRVNCSAKASMSTYIPIINYVSTVGVGGCFLGPQLQHWDMHSSVPLKDIVADVMNQRGINATCLPSSTTIREQQIPLEWVDADKINNIYEPTFRLTVFVLLITYVLAVCLFQKCVVLHPYFDALERNRETKPRGGDSEAMLSVSEVELP